MVVASVLYGLSFAIGIGISDVIATGLTRRLGVMKTVFLLQLVGVFGLSVVGWWSGQFSTIDGRGFVLLAPMTLVVALFYLGFYRALQLGPIALVGPIVAAHSIVVILLAMVVLDEPVTTWQLMTMAATIVGVAIASVDWASLRAGSLALGMGVILAIVVSLAAGFWQFALAYISKDLGWFPPVFITRLFMVGLLLPVVAMRRERVWNGLSPKLAIGVITVGIVETGALSAFTRGSEVGIVWIVAAASTAYPIVPIVGGIVLFRERVSAVQFLGLFILMLGLVGLALLR